MNVNRLSLFAVLAAVVLCVALTWSNVAAANRVRELQAQLEAKEAELQKYNATKRSGSAKAMTADAGLTELLDQRDAKYAQLREENEKLRQQLAGASAVNATTSAVTSTPTRVNFNQFPGRNMSNYLDRIRQQDPERYQQIVQQMQQRQQRADQEYDDQTAGLVQRAQAAPTQEEADLVSQIADALDKVNQLRQSRAALANLPEDQQQAQSQSINDQLRAAYAQLNDLRTQDRTLQLQQLAAQLGLKDPQALVDGVAKVYKNTQYNPQRGPGGPGGPGGGGASQQPAQP